MQSNSEFEEAVSDPEAFFKKLLTSGGPAARRMLIAQCRPHVEPSLPKQGLQWSDVQPVLESVESQDELQQAMNDPDSFLKQLLAGAGGEVARNLLSKLNPRCEPLFAAAGRDLGRR